MGIVTISEKDFQRLIAKRVQKLLSFANHLSQCGLSSETLTRPFLGEFLSQSMQLEEFLDAYGAHSNCQWCSFRSLMAAIKLFSDVSYELLHIQHALPAYRLLPIEKDFARATQEALEFTGNILIRAAKETLAKAGQLGLSISLEDTYEKSCSEELPPGRLPCDCGMRRTETVAETVTLLARAFLNLAAVSKDVRAASKAKPEEYSLYLSGAISEESLRSLELRFHNLQSLYDTYVSGTEAEDLDTDLPVLRGHISVVFHLLKTATSFAHYYERHLSRQSCNSPLWHKPLLKTEAMLDVLMNYSITHISLYIDCAENLCRQMLKHYTDPGQIEVPLPLYRGFHVRPATLISKLVMHYGSEVKMQMDEEVYDAGSSLELFRSNEKINARKRRFLAAEIVRLKLVQDWATGKDIKTVIRDAILTLAEKSKLIIYEQPLQLPDEVAKKEGTLLERVIDETSQLLALGKIDIETDMTVIFTGDKRVLADIKLLAESGYGEDKIGNNIPLPEKLVYLR